MEHVVTPQLGQRLKARREALGWSLRDLEEHSGVHNSLIYKIERGRIENPALDKIRALAEAMELSATAVLIEDGQLDLPDYRDYLALCCPHLPAQTVTRLERYLQRTVQAASAAVGEEA